MINEQLAIESLKNIQTLPYWIAAEILNAKDESKFIHKEVLDKSVVGNIKNILMNMKTKSRDLQKYMVS